MSALQTAANRPAILFRLQSAAERKVCRRRRSGEPVTFCSDIERQKDRTERTGNKAERERETQRLCVLKKKRETEP